jgi:hypothetical protein
VLRATPIEMPREVGLDDGRQHGHPILVALGATHDDLVAPEIDILDTEAAAFEQTESRAIQQRTP